ncbi:hypothetical protein LXL04_006368 [Taraxacum kok-saghyz]
MVEHQTGVLNSEQWPQFFKLYMPAHCSTQLRIPPAFLKYFGDSLPFKFTLQTSPTNSWEVHMNKIDDDVYFKTGWEKFAQDNLLEFGDFLIFYYHGGSNFYVSISGINNCLKDINITNNNIQNQPTVTPLQESETEETSNSHKQATEGIEIEDSNLSFEITVQPSYIKNGFMNMPKRVFYDVVKENRPMRVKLQHLGRTWDVMVSYRCERIKLTSGWKEFARENCLGVGDVCCFKVVDIKPDFYLLDVSFCREM